MTTEVIDNNDCSLIMSKISSFKYRDNFFKINPGDKTNDNSLEVIDSPKNLNLRKDAFGNLIKKGKKEHKITFIDEVSNNNLTEEFKIMKYKNKTNSINFNQKEYNKYIYKLYEQKFKEYYNSNKLNNKDKVDVKCQSCNIF